MFITYSEALSPKLLLGIGASKTILSLGRARKWTSRDARRPPRPPPVSGITISNNGNNSNTSNSNNSNINNSNSNNKSKIIAIVIPVIVILLVIMRPPPAGHLPGRPPRRVRGARRPGRSCRTLSLPLSLYLSLSPSLRRGKRTRQFEKSLFLSMCFRVRFLAASGNMQCLQLPWSFLTACRKET